MICPKCKKEIKANTRFCGYCGMKISSNSGEVNKKEELKNNVTTVDNSVTVNSEEKESPMNKAIRENHEKIKKILTEPIPQKEEKDASVIKRGIVGGVVAGPAGAIVGALSAIDKNNKKDK